jgi:putative ABC transport system permease protein
MNWLSQIISISLVNLRTIPQRKGAAITAAVGIAGVVGVLVGVLAISEGFRKTMAASGSPEVAIVLRGGANNEMSSGLSRDEVRAIMDAPGIARNAQGALSSAQLFVLIDLAKRTTGTPANVPLRGVDDQAFDVFGNIQMVEGRRFERGKNEVIVGVGAAREFSGIDVGKEIKIGLNQWKVVGVFSAGGGASESEVWSDEAVLRPAYNRSENYQSVYARLNSVDSFNQFKDALTTNPQLDVKVSRLADFYIDQSSMLTGFITGLGYTIAGMMALGALFAALNTMYSAVAARTREIATLRALGFGTLPVIFSVLVESVVIAIIGGAVGATIAYLAFDGFTAATINFQTFSQIAFSFAVTPALLTQAIIWATGLGLFGGLFPAIRAARLPIASGLRES